MLNPKWVKGMLQHGYKGCFELSASLDYLFAYDAVTDAIPDWCYSEICDKWIKDKYINKKILENNPWALRDICERLLESINRGLWENASKSQKDFLKSNVISTEAYIESKGITKDTGRDNH